MKRAFALQVLLLAAGCTAPTAGPRHAAVVSPPAPPPTLVVPPAQTDWRDLPLTPGSWRYAAAPGGSVARYGTGDTPVLVMRCDLSARAVRLELPGTTGPLTVRTSSSTRTLPPGGALASRDPFLDEIAFSRGRFSVAAAAAATLYLPAWAEPARVVEDCRG
jgi:hypothetical protein